MEEKRKFDNIMIATDGSEKSKLAFQLALTFYEFTNLFDQIIVSHVSDKNKTYLPQHWKPDYIYNEYKTELLSLFPSDKYKLCFEEKKQDKQSCREQILEMAQSMKVSFLFIGFTGRKGDKENQTVLSQTVKHSAFHSTVPLVICKRFSKREEQKSKGFTFLSCVDGSQKSYYAMKLLFDMATDPNDKVVVCYSPLPDKLKYKNTIKAEVEEQINNMQTKTNFEYVCLEPSSNPGLAISQYINDAQNNWVNFVGFGNNGYRAMIEKTRFFGREAESILLNAKANLIIVS